MDKKVVVKSILRIILGFVFFFPIYYLIITAIKPPDILFASPPRLIFKPSWKTLYQIIITQGNYLFFLNSLSVSIIAPVATLLLASTGAFAFAYKKFRGHRQLLFACLVARMFPPVTTLIPIYFMISYLGLLDTKLGLIIPYISLQIPLVLLIMKKFFEQLPFELFESALLDGCTPLGLFWKIAVPLSKPGLLSSGILCLVFCWNEFLFGFVLTSSEARTAPVALATYIEAEGMVQWGTIAALGVGTILPILIFVGAMHKYLIKGLTAGGIKG